MKSYFLPKRAVKGHIFNIVALSFNASSIFYLWISSENPWSTWLFFFTFIAVLTSILGIIFSAKSIYEPSLKIQDDKIKIESPDSVLETSTGNLSHVEIKTQSFFILDDYKYQFIYFKEPVMSCTRFLGINLWKKSNAGFRLDIVDEKAQEEIKMVYIKDNLGMQNRA